MIGHNDYVPIFVMTSQFIKWIYEYKIAINVIRFYFFHKPIQEKLNIYYNTRNILITKNLQFLFLSFNNDL